MKIACVDKSAADRVKLQKLLDEAYEQCRGAVGHIPLAKVYPASKDEVLLNSPPDVIAIGPSFFVEEAHATSRQLSEAFPETPIILFLPQESYSLRTLRRFERFCSEIFSTADPAIRVVHKLSTFEGQRSVAKAGKIVTVNGVKGGVGTTTLVGAFAHAAEALGKTAIVLDLSQASVFAQYMGAERLQSADYSALLSDNLTPDSAIVSRCVTTAPNGIQMLLPPSGGNDIRELWLRHPQRFDVTLAMLDVLREQYDVVLIDVARVEGVLQFAIGARAHVRVLVTSNEPAAVHLLNSTISSLADAPGEGRLSIVVNQIVDRSLTKDDILDFLSMNEHFEDFMTALPPIPFDNHGRSWIGTGNTFFTECSRQTQQILEHSLAALLAENAFSGATSSSPKKLIDNVRILTGRFSQRSETRHRALPVPEKLRVSDWAAPQHRQENANGRHQVNVLSGVATEGTNHSAEMYGLSVSLEVENNRAEEEQAFNEGSLLYEAPTLVANNYKE